MVPVLSCSKQVGLPEKFSGGSDYGTNIYFVAAPTTVFIGIIGTSSGTPAGVATNNNQVGVAYGLTKDTASGFW